MRVRMAIRKSWKELELFLCREVTAGLRSPLTLEDISALERAHDVKLPVHVAESYMVHDGEEESGNFGGTLGSGSFRLLPLA
eukprot:CAMPEP_0114570860 /NCGR_PEP_ID=MMETSP0114-20121206/17434_1 /TAXON_ID=31324 /ORGANISM="Goniomonas sp, Strain m" /LENGTH=81 /DNA_ID=CAMNT_0001757933 /DNA_START=175 /DNA_END=417 /DNA_ORIENTATION=+